MRKRRDPDKLQVSARDYDDAVFISWLYDEGSSGTFSLSPDAALRFAKALKAAALSLKGDEE